jgi:hypothetical protein
MADDINKKITLDVQVNSNGLQQLDKYSGAVTSLNASVSNLLETMSQAQSDVNALQQKATNLTTASAKQVKQANDTISGFIKSLKSFGKTVGTIFSNSFKSIFSNAESYYKKPLKDGSDAAIKSNATTNTTIEKNTKASQDKIRASEIESAQKTADSIFSIMTKSNDAVRDRAILIDEKARKDELQADGDNKDAINRTNRKFDRLENDAKKKAFKANQKVARAQAIMNGAIAITKAEAELGPIAGTIALGAIVAQTAAQLAVI